MKFELPIEGMTCEHCVRTVTQALARVPGVQKANVSLADKRAVVETENGLVTRERLAAAVTEAGYQVTDASPAPAVPPVDREASAKNGSTAGKSQPAELLLDIEGMHCASCVGNVERAVSKLPGVRSARVNLATEQAAVEFEPARINPQAVISAIEQAGYGRCVLLRPTPWIDRLPGACRLATEIMGRRLAGGHPDALTSNSTLRAIGVLRSRLLWLRSLSSMSAGRFSTAPGGGCEV